ncbi:MAG: nickel-dependent lactate racemase [Clostridiaceae bacterium]|nr:nickel-dependent lactate racemase [Clostridiaceae bacterium]
MLIKIPYGKTKMEVEIDEKRLLGVFESRVEKYKSSGTETERVLDALRNPTGTARLSMITKKYNRILIITSDHTRPVPSKLTLPLILSEIRSENPEAEIKILIATGMHRPITRDEIIEKFGNEIAKKEDLNIHNSEDKKSMTFKGLLPSGGELWVNSLVDWADFIIAEGFIEPHFFAGFSGGRKSILPGIASKETVMYNHNAEFIASSLSRAGTLKDNPVHKDMVYAAKVCGLKFILNVVLNSRKEVIRAFAGDWIKAHKAGCSFVMELAQVKPKPSDIVITSNGGYPLDQNIYQAVKGMTSAESCVKKGGIIIMAASCTDGHGGQAFYEYFAKSKTVREVTERILRIPSEKTRPDQWQAQILARVMEKAKVIFVTNEKLAKTVEEMHMTYAPDLKTAVSISDSILGKNSGIAVIPDGVSVIVK